MNIERRHAENELSKHDIFYRIAGHTIMIFLLLTSLIDVSWSLVQILPTRPELKIFLDIGPRYATVWIVNIHLIYACMALTCDLSQVLDKVHLFPKKLYKFRYTWFSGLFYPLGMALPIVFWPIYIYDRELVFPTKVDVFMSFYENFVCHFLVAVYALYELIFIPRHSLMGQRTYKYTVWFFVLYILAFYFTKYVDLGVWMYGVYDVLEGTIYFYMLLGSPLVYSTIFYITQTRTQEAIWRYREKLQRNVKYHWEK